MIRNLHKRQHAILQFEKDIEEEIIHSDRRQHDANLMQVLLKYGTNENDDECVVLLKDFNIFISDGKVDRVALRAYIRITKSEVELDVEIREKFESNIDITVMEAFDGLHCLNSMIENGNPKEVTDQINKRMKKLQEKQQEYQTRYLDQPVQPDRPMKANSISVSMPESFILVKNKYSAIVAPESIDKGLLSVVG